MKEREGYVRAADRTGQAPPGKRWRSSFEWELVDSALLRDLIASLPDGRDALADVHDPALLVDVAGRVFGTQLPKRSMTRVAPVLLERWLPHARDDTLARLTNIIQTALGKAYLDKVYATRASQVDFLQARKKTNNFLENLRDAFHREHRASWLIPKAGAGEDARGVYDLRGQGGDPLYAPYPHTLEAQRTLDELKRAGPVRGLVVLPTGAGKTDVAVGWLLQQLQRDPQLRVLWLAHQISLLDQSAARFERAAHQLPAGFERTLRIFAGDREPTSLLDRRHTHIACATIQTISRKLDRRSRRRTEVSNFLKGPTIVIVDEAHHVASRSYQMLLDLVGDAEIHDVVGLTATPWGQGERQDRIDAAFPQRVISRTREELIADGVLAAYTVTPVRTHLRIPVTAEERDQAERVGDLPMTVLRKLETNERNAVVLRAYEARAEAWGRTLLFTTTIENADDLVLHFKAAGIDARALHSQSEATLSDLRPWFKEHPRAVLISVGMLLEGVDLPEARTALIARATTSPNVLSQMVGRVLRGIAAGGEATANVVYLQDDWEDFTAVLSPTGPWEGGDGAPSAAGPPDVAAAVAAALRALSATAPEDGPAPDVQIALEQRQIVGAYELPDATVPVFDHQYELLREHLLRGGPFLWPDDAPPPPVATEHLERLELHVAEHGAPPPFHPVARSLAPIDVARTLSDDTPRTYAERQAVIAAAYDDPLAQVVYPTSRHFAEAVEHWQRQLARPRVPEAPLPDVPGRPPLPRRPDRSLEPTLELVLRRAPELLPETRRHRLVRPHVRWSNRVTKSYLGMWRLGDTPGEHRIVINVLLQTQESIVSEELLGFLLWHEVVHSVTPGQGHDAEFEYLEGKWPDAVALNTGLDAVLREWSADPADY
ncbi:DEAD/DEAH box helicase family protein [Solirubrobacter ginsenosidimutans]|uniref:DEAD/DEAH box helicase family protein n=1 Tax=Solirubrobacter ginsenosidimutans TaxID=490573 RepID=A0A9X3MWL8_9ACTN|nr:DEAD/DEAH box helicase family protein [Solirubrobacter ginsenosidimutans]MDA0164094.1 DEAD/DEAH box helicase family protein [Solirubrobacter ginsenosidimutans]